MLSIFETGIMIIKTLNIQVEVSSNSTRGSVAEDLVRSRMCLKCQENILSQSNVC